MRKIGPIPIVAIVGSLLIMLLAAIYFYPVFGLVFGLGRLVSERERQLLYHTDHAALAVEARNFQSQWRSRFGMPGSEPRVLEPDDTEIPNSLRILKPTSAVISNDRIELEFGGALLHYGIVVFDEGLEGNGTKRLAKGVWFYSENGRYPTE